GSGDLVRHLIDAADGVRDRSQGASDVLHLIDAALDQVLAVIHALASVQGSLTQVADDVLDVSSGLLSALGQCTHLIGHNSKAAPLFACPGRFNGSVEGQKVGLLCDAADDIHNTGNLATVGGQLIQHLAQVSHSGGQIGNGSVCTFDYLITLIHLTDSD